MTGPFNRVRLILPRAHFDVDVDLHLPSRGITVLFGASGCGKTSILRCVAGLERAASGLVRIGDAVWQDDARRLFVPTWKRPLGYVFQEASLFDHLDVRGNLEYGLRRSGTRNGARILDEAVELLGIASLLGRRPSRLSGGERQRVAIARALATEPQLLLLDEPLASLDLPRRREIMPWLERLRDHLSIPMLYVTHSVEELGRLADHVVVLEHGKAVEAGPVGETMTGGRLSALAGDEAGAVIAGTIADVDAHWRLARVEFAGGSLSLRDPGLAAGTPVRVRVLARDVSLSLKEPAGSTIQNHFPVTVENISADTHPAQALVRLHCGTQSLLARVTRKAVADLDIRPGQPLWAQVKSVAILG